MHALYFSNFNLYVQNTHKFIINMTKNNKKGGGKMDFFTHIAVTSTVFCHSGVSEFDEREHNNH